MSTKNVGKEQSYNIFAISDVGVGIIYKEEKNGYWKEVKLAYDEILI